MAVRPPLLYVLKEDHRRCLVDGLSCFLVVRSLPGFTDVGQLWALFLCRASLLFGRWWIGGTPFSLSVGKALDEVSPV